MLKRVEEGDTRAEQVVAMLAQRAGMSRGQVEVMAAEVARKLAHSLQRLTLSRGGLADVVQLLGEAVPGGADADGAMRHAQVLFGSQANLDALATACAHRAGVGIEQAAQVLPAIIEMQVVALADRSRGALTDLFARLPSLFHWSLGSMHADIADIIRRGCGAGPFDRGKLRRQVRSIIAEAAGYAHTGAAGWYAARALAPARVAVCKLHGVVTRPLV